MNTKHEFGEIQRKNMEAAMRLAQISIENSQRIMALQSQLARELFENSVDQAKAQASSKDPQDIVDAFQSFFKALPGPNTNFLETMQQAMTNANTAYDQMSRAAKGAFETPNDPAKKATPGKAKK